MTTNLHLRWAELVVDGLVSAGVREVVLSPGSRSTPLALAAWARSELTCRVIVDERSAGFFAVGQGRAAGRPSVLVCTSGTAGANYLPAVVEASESGVPLVVVTADRPPELQARGALQTTAQADFFRGFVRLALDLGVPDADPRALRGARSGAALAVGRSLAPRPGPVHVNAPFRKPLEPVPGPPESSLDDAVSALRDEPGPRWAGAVRQPDDDALEALEDACLRARRGLIVAGPALPAFAAARPAVARLVERLGFPLLAEASSQLRFTDGGPAAVGLYEYLLPPPPALAPDLVLQLGAWPTSAAAGRWLDSDAAPERWVIEPDGRGDPANRARGVVAADVAAAVTSLAARLQARRPKDRGWVRSWHDADADIAGALDTLLREEADEGRLSEAGAARAVVDALPGGAALVVANSLAIREVDVACPATTGDRSVITQRGVSGIDGLVSGAAGVATVTRAPAVLLVGDLALLHDVGGLAALRHVATPLVVVVLQNRGGRIFDLLPLERTVDPAVVESVFAAPQSFDVQHAAAAFGIAYRRCGDAAALGAAVAEGAASGVTVIEAVMSGPGVRERRLALKRAAERWAVAQERPE